MHISAYEVCLERVAEELMRPMKWKHCEAFGHKHMNTEQLLTLSPDTSQIEEQQKQLQQQQETEETFIAEKLENISLQHTQVDEKEDSEIITVKNETDQKDNLTAGENILLNKLTENKHEKENAHNKVNTSRYNSDITNNSNNNHNSEQETDQQAKAHTCNCNIPPTALKSLLFTKLPPPPAVDWKPNEKCHFCDNGKLLTVNSKGELIAEKNSPFTEHIKIASDSDSNDSSAITNNFHSYRRKHRSDDNSQVNHLKKLLTSRLKDLPTNMTSMDSMAARIAAIQSISGQIYPNINFLHLAQLQQQQQQQEQQDQEQEQDSLQQATSQTPLEKTNSVTPTTSNEISTVDVSPSAKESPSPSEVTGEQPLDLSSKPSPNSSISGDQKLARSKSSRVMPANLSRAYSDDDVNNALQDIISRKLGSRKSAALYNVPHSVLRHKINNMTLEAKRNNNTTLTTELLQLQQEMERDLLSDEEHENSDDEADRSDATATPLSATPTDLIHKRQTDTPTSSNAASLAATPLSNNTATTPLTTNPNWLEETMLLRTLLLTMGARLHPNIDENMTLRDFISLLVTATTQQQQQVTSPLIDATNNLINNGKSTSSTTVAQALTNNSGSSNSNNNNNSSGNNMLDQRLLLQILQQQQQPSPSSSSVTMTSQQTPPFLSRIAKSETPDTNSSMDANDAYDEASSILKIPSFKPVAGSSNTPSPNNNNNNNSNSAILTRNGESPGGVPSVPPPPLLRRASQSPPTFSALRDVIVSKFQRTLNEPLNKDGNSASGNDYKKPCISVVKNIGGTDTARFGAAPNLLSDHAHNSTHHLPHAHSHAAHNHHFHHHQQQLSRQEAAALAAGKGTRPKRGKYRNYDRDSLIEAVKAVQRGEMSVHRAGSYYGVPHSTLEYKVKERHLMRPRKREPKPQPGLESSKSSLLMNSVDKNKAVVGHKLSQALKNNNNNNNANNNNNSNGNASGSNSSGNFPNGLKLAPHNMFDAAALASQMQYPPAASLFWPTTPTAAAVAAAQFGPLAHIDFTSRMQRYQEDILRGSGTGTGMSSPNSHSSHLEGNHHQDQSIYANLDGIIRQTLDRKSDPRELATDSLGAGGSTGTGTGLLDQLLIKKSSLPYSNKEPISGSNKRLGSPLTFHQSDIKRERTSPQLQSSSGDEDEISLHSSVDTENHSKTINNNNNNNNSNNEQPHGLLMTVPQQQNSHNELPSGSGKNDMFNMLHYNNNNKSVVSSNGGNDLQNCEKDATETTTNTTETTLPVCDNNRLQEKLAQIKAEHQDDDQL